MFNHQWRKLIIVLGDIVILYMALWLMLLVRYGELPQPERWVAHVWPFTLVNAVYVVSFAVVGLYQLSVARNNRAFTTALTQAMVSATAIAGLYFYLTRPGIAPRFNLILFVAITSILITLWRRILNTILGSTLLVRTLILGYSRDAVELAKTLVASPQLGFHLVAFALNPSETSHHGWLKQENIPAHILAQDALHSFVRAERIELVIPASAAHMQPELVKYLYSGNQNRVSVTDLPTIFEAVTGKVAVQSINELWFLEHSALLTKPLYEVVKRFADIILASIALIPALILAPFIYAAVKLDSPGSGFFTQQRVGKDGKTFLAIKFRSMFISRCESTNHANQRMATNSTRNNTSHMMQVMPDDKRITRVGKILRQTRIDELPQLLNILKGDMSFVGPRPEQPALVEQLSAAIPFYRERLAVKPGLTGWDQISGVYHSASVDDTLEKLQYDLYYIKNRSLILDITILLRTIKTVLSAEGK